MQLRCMYDTNSNVLYGGCTFIHTVIVLSSLMYNVDDTDLDKDLERQKLLPRSEKKDKYGII